MLTRSQVAKRLGKSIATVRRLEGSVLHPTQDRDGVHRFDAHEVDEVKHGIAPTSVEKWRPRRMFDTYDQDDGNEGDRTDQAAPLEDARRVAVGLREQLHAANARIVELTNRVAELNERRPDRDDSVAEAYLEWLDSRSKAQLRHLALGGTEEFLDVLDGLHRRSR